MLNEQELVQVRDYVIRILPELIRREPEIATTIEGIIAHEFPRRDEFARLLEQMEQHHTEMHDGFGAVRGEMHAGFDAIRGEMNQGFDEIRQEVRGGLDSVRAEMGERFGQVDQRFEQVDQRFEQVDQRFEQVDQRFEQVDQRFEQVDQRFEQVDQRFEQVDRSLLGIRRDLARIDHGQQMLIKRMDGQEAWLKLVIGDLRIKKGELLEDLVATALRYGLKNPDIAPESIRLRQKLLDPEGRYFKRSRVTEVDLIVEDGKLVVFEVKASAEASDVDYFAQKVQLLTEQNPDKQVHGIFITLAADPEVREACHHYGLELAE
ncbi:MAG: hypothetical protein AB1791_05620 [Chloroflexota bacterium]